MNFEKNRIGGKKKERLKINDLAFYLKTLEKIKHKERKRKEKVKKKKI